ncbi:MAG: hypothetical protein RL755_1206 [Pseudomonadota bacterium]
MPQSTSDESKQSLNEQNQNAGAFAVIKNDGSVVAWGNPENGGDVSAVSNMLDGSINVVQIYSAKNSFAALRADGSVVIWGDDFKGNRITTQIPELDGSINVVNIYSNNVGFVALRENGSLVTWGEVSDDYSSNTVKSKIDGFVDVKSVSLTDLAFAALRIDGSVVTWGDANSGGDSNAVSMQIDGSVPVKEIYSNGHAFAALREDGSVVTWGDQLNGGYVRTALKSQLDGKVDVKEIYPNEAAGVFCALLNDGSVVTWGNASFGLTNSKSQIPAGKNVLKVFSNQTAFVAQREDGSVSAWGDVYNGAAFGSIEKSLNGDIDVVDIVSSDYAFAALRKDGSVITWGQASSGGDSSTVASKLDGSTQVIKIVSNGSAFAAIRADGSVVTWGQVDSGGDSSSVAKALDGQIDVKVIFSNPNAFAALRDDGSVVTWGLAGGGGDSRAVKEKLDGTIKVTTIVSDDDGIVNGRTLTTSSAFAALRVDGSVVTWGASNVGGDSSSVASQINTNVLGFANESIDPLLIDVTKGAVNPFNNLPTGAVTIQSNTKVYTVGSILTATNTIKDTDDLGDFTYQWQTDLGVLASNTSKTYTLTKNEVGQQIWVSVNYTDKLGTFEKVKSALTSNITISKKASIADDEITGTTKADKLSGGLGNDTLIGGLGKDNLTGGVGADIFKFNAVNDTAAIAKNADTITDFKSNEKDKIDLSAIDANSTLIGNQAFKFVSGVQFDSSLIGQVYFNSKDQTVYGTTRVDNKIEFAIHLTGVKIVVADDFIL